MIFQINFNLIQWLTGHCISMATVCCEKNLLRCKAELLRISEMHTSGHLSFFLGWDCLVFDHVRIATFFCGKTWVGKGCQLPFVRKFRFNGMIKVLPYCWGWRRMKLQGHTDNWVKCCQRELQIVPCRFLCAPNVVVKKLAQWNTSNKEEAMILQKLCYPNIQMFLGLGLAREWCTCHFKIPQHKQKVCHFRKCRWRKLTKWGKLVGYYISSLWCGEVFALLSWNPPMATIQTILWSNIDRMHQSWNQY